MISRITALLHADANQQILSYDEEKDRKVVEYVDEWINQTSLQADKGDSSDDMAPPSESSPDDAGRQADEPYVDTYSFPFLGWGWDWEATSWSQHGEGFFDLACFR